MNVTIPLENCFHLKQVSCYNSNYYELPFSVNKCNSVHVSYGGNEDLSFIALGYFEEGHFKEKYFLNTSLIEDEILDFDSSQISIDNRWT